MDISFSPNKSTHRNHHQHAQHNHHEPDIVKTTGATRSSSRTATRLATTPQTHLSNLIEPNPHTCDRCGKIYKSGPALGGHKKYCGKQINQLHIHQPKISVDSENLSGLALICSIVHPVQPTTSTSSSIVPLSQPNKQTFTAEETTCPHCSFVFARPGGLAKHLKKNVCLHKNLQLHEATRNNISTINIINIKHQEDSSSGEEDVSDDDEEGYKNLEHSIATVLKSEQCTTAVKDRNRLYRRFQNEAVNFNHNNFNNNNGKYSKRHRSNVAVIIVKIVFISAFLFYCLLLNHSFQTNPNKITRAM